MSRWGVLSGDPEVRLLRDGRNVTVLVDLTYTPISGNAITVPAGFVCDGASIPRILWPLAGGPFEGTHRNGALFHDYLYWRSRQGCALGTRKDADRIFYQIMRLFGHSVWSARSKWSAVRLFSGPAWGP
jgi:hypothetical protein